MINKLRSRIEGVARDMGWSDGLLYLAARAVRSITLGRVELRKYYFVSQAVAERPLLPKNRGATITVERIDRSHPFISRFPRPAHVIAARFDSNAECFLATKDDEFVGFLWLQRGTYREDEVRCLFMPLPAAETVWDFDVHVEPTHRSSFAFARLWDTANQYLRDTGITWSVSRISAFNPGSINSHARLGAFPIGSAVFLNGREWQLMLSPLSSVHFSCGEKSVPEIAMAATLESRKPYRRFNRLK